MHAQTLTQADHLPGERLQSSLDDSHTPTWMRKRTTNWFLRNIEEYRKLENRMIYERLVHEFTLDNSSDMRPSDFGRYADFASHIFNALKVKWIRVRRTEPNFLWHSGAGPLPTASRCTLNQPGGGVIFLDPAGPHLRELSLIESLIRCAIHATGPTLGRWTADEQPLRDPFTLKGDLAFITEEAIVTAATTELMTRSGICHHSIDKAVNGLVHTLTNEIGAHQQAVDIEGAKIQAHKAVRWLLYGKIYDDAQIAANQSVPWGIDFIVQAFRRIASKT